jgi:hypothetical protein
MNPLRLLKEDYQRAQELFEWVSSWEPLHHSAGNGYARG